MWPFKKNTANRNNTINVNTVICVPGYWKSVEDIFFESIDEIRIADNLLIDFSNNRSYEIEFCYRDERMMSAFVVSSFAKLTPGFLDEIQAHSSVLYLTGRTGNIEECRLIAKIIKKLFVSGAIGVKVETAGKAFDRENWSLLAELFDDSNIYELFVMDSLAKPDETVYSCGMHNLGLKDTIVSGLLLDEAIDLVKIFNYYQVIDKPVILEGQTFRSSVESPLIRISNEINQIYKGEELFENPYGMWRLTKE